MSIVNEHFNQISDFHSRRQVRAAILAMPNFESRKMMIDKVLQRRQEINLSQENFKIMKYAHIFRRFLSKFRNGRKPSPAPAVHETSINEKGKQSGVLSMEHENAVTAVENSIIAQSNQSSILDFKFGHMEEALISMQHLKRGSVSPSRGKPLDNLNALTYTVQREKEDRRKNVQENSEFFIQQAKQLQEATFVKKERISNIVKKAVSKIDTGIRPARLNTLRAQRSVDQEKELTVRRRQAQVLSESARQLSLEIPKRIFKSETQKTILTDRSVDADINKSITKLPHLGKYFTITDPLQVREQIENEIFNFLMEQKQLNPMQKVLFLQSDPNSQTKTHRNMESKIKYKLQSQFVHEQDIFNKYTYSVAEILGKKLGDQRASKKDIKLSSIQLPTQQAQTSRALKKTLEIQKQAANQSIDESFASYTEIKLNNLYSTSKEIQLEMKEVRSEEMIPKNIRIKLEKKGKRIEDKLVQNAKEIIELCSKKMTGIKSPLQI